MSLAILAIIAHLSNPARTIYSVAPNLTDLEVASLPVPWVIGQGKSKIKNNHASEYQVLLLLLSNPVNGVLLNVAKIFLAVTLGNISQEYCCTELKSFLERGKLFCLKRTQFRKDEMLVSVEKQITCQYT